MSKSSPLKVKKGSFMPKYHYECEKCGYEFKINQNISDPPRKRCPKCRGKVYRVIKPVGHILKGSGFYRTDYRSEDYSKKEKEARKKTEAGEDSSSSKTDKAQAGSG